MIDSVDLRDESNVTVLGTSCEGEHGNKLDEIVHSLELGHSSAPWSPMESHGFLLISSLGSNRSSSVLEWST